MSSATKPASSGKPNDAIQPNIMDVASQGECLAMPRMAPISML